jgi:hypothetical protein
VLHTILCESLDKHDLHLAHPVIVKFYTHLLIKSQFSLEFQVMKLLERLLVSVIQGLTKKMYTSLMVKVKCEVGGQQLIT